MRNCNFLKKVIGVFCISLAIGVIVIAFFPRWVIICLLLSLLIAIGVYLLKY